jgi:hypothetical protein
MEVGEMLYRFYLLFSYLKFISNGNGNDTNAQFFGQNNKC